jgi:TolB protein
MDDRLSTVLRRIERNEPDIAWADVEERLARAPARRPARPATIVVGLALTLGSVGILAVTVRPYGEDAAAGGRPGAILFDYRRTIATNDVRRQQVQVWSVEPDGSNPRLVFDVPEAYDDGARWSPDGTRILLSSFTPDGEGGVFVMNADGTGMREVLSGFACGSLSWFPDGRGVLCGGGPWREGEDGRNELEDDGVWRIELGSGEARKVLGAGFADPVVSPDGRRVAVVGVLEQDDRDTVSELFVANVDGTGLRRLTSDGGGHYAEAVWSPDGSSLAASWEPAGGVLAFDVYRVDASDGSRVRLTDWDGWDSSPVWSPDGSRIAFMSDRTADPRARERWLEMGSGPFEQSVFVMDADGSDPTLVFRGEAFAAPTSWGPGA